MLPEAIYPSCGYRTFQMAIKSKMGETNLLPGSPESRAAEVGGGWWEVEVVCDNAMGLPERTGTEVLEVVVPSDYKCPNGGKFKARATLYNFIADLVRSLKLRKLLEHTLFERGPFLSDEASRKPVSDSILTSAAATTGPSCNTEARDRCMP